MSDLVKSLRDACEDENGNSLPWTAPPEGLTIGDVQDAIHEIEALEAALRQAREALTNARAGFHLAYEAAEKGFVDEALLHCGHHSAQPAKAIAAINDLLKD